MTVKGVTYVRTDGNFSLNGDNDNRFVGEVYIKSEEHIQISGLDSVFESDVYMEVRKDGSDKKEDIEKYGKFGGDLYLEGNFNDGSQYDKNRKTSSLKNLGANGTSTIEDALAGGGSGGGTGEPARVTLDDVGDAIWR